MAKSHYLIGCALIFATGAALIALDQWQIGLCLAVPSVLIGVIIAITEPSAATQRHTLIPPSPVPEQSSTASGAEKTLVAPLPQRGSAVAPEATSSRPPGDAPPARQSPPVAYQDDKVRELAASLARLSEENDALAKLANSKSREAEILSAKLRDRRDIRILQRVAQFQHVLEFNRLMMGTGKIAADEALREFELELESAMDSLGVKVHPIEVGSKVRDLPNGSFELISGELPSTPEQAGTVKAVRQSALTYTDPEGKTHFLIPAKIDAFKLS